jgi:hypothetical protein
MGMDLVRPNGYFHWNNSGWRHVLAIGQEFGWVPEGTGPPHGSLKRHWRHGSYTGNNGQRFGARDARKLAEALARSIPILAMPGAGILTRPADVTDKLEAALTGRKLKKGGRISIPPFGRNDILYLRKFIRFCRVGSFRVY